MCTGTSGSSEPKAHDSHRICEDTRSKRVRALISLSPTGKPRSSITLCAIGTTPQQKGGSE